MRLLIHEASYARLRADLDALPGVDPLVIAGSGEVSLRGEPVEREALEPDAAWANADVFFSPAGRVFFGVLGRAQSLKWVQSGAAGTDAPVFQDLIGRGVRFTTSHGQAVGIAEYVVAGVMDALQRGPDRRAAQAERRWARINFREVGGTHWLVIGFGAIGQGVAARARALGASVTGVRRTPGSHPAADRMARLDQAAALAGEADVVVLCCPLTPDTRHIVNAGFLSAMKPGSILVNVGRGGLVDEPALLAALDRGVPERAILDVFEVEPLPDDSPFWTHPRVALTAHTSGDTAGQPLRNDVTFLENLRRYVAGEPLLNEVTSDG